MQTPCSAGKRGLPHVAIDFSFAFDWLRDWRKFSRSVTDRSEAKPIQPWITFDTQLKFALTLRHYFFGSGFATLNRKGLHSKGRAGWTT